MLLSWFLCLHFINSLQQCVLILFSEPGTVCGPPAGGKGSSVPCRGNVTSSGDADHALMLNVALEVSLGSPRGKTRGSPSTAAERLLRGSPALSCLPLWEDTGHCWACALQSAGVSGLPLWLFSSGCGPPSDSYPPHGRLLQGVQPRGCPVSTLGSPEGNMVHPTDVVG